jgi:hypothetical protein
MRRALPPILGLAAVVLPTVMLALAYGIDRKNIPCYGNWSDGDRSAYEFLVYASPFLAAGLTFAWIALLSRNWWRWLLAVIGAFSALAVFGIAALVVAYMECA